MSTMRTVAVFFAAPGFDAYPFDVPDFRLAYEDLGAIVASKGGRFAIVRGQDTYRGGMTFRGGWIHDGTAFHREDGQIVADVILNKGRFCGDPGITVVNDPELTAICTNKERTYALFPAHCPRTVTVHDTGELNAALNGREERMIVCKPLEGEQGRSVFIATGQEIRDAGVLYPSVVQDFIDTSGGVPGIVEGCHDFRIIGLGSRIGASYVRTPPPGKMVANVAQGGAEISVGIDEIPAEALTVYRAVDAALSRFPRRAYSVDMGRDADGKWLIIELNAEPGPPAPTAGERYVLFLDMLADLLLA